MKMRFSRSALAVIAATMAGLVAPPESIAPSVWAESNLVVPDGPHAGERWQRNLTPYVVEPLDQCGPEAPVNEIAVMKSGQSGFSTLLLAAIGHTIDCDPCRQMLVQPTSGALGDFAKDKLGIALERSRALAEKVYPQTSRSSEGSTITSKRYPGGSLDLAIASSAADLRSKTIKKAWCDEIDEYPDDLDGQGDPLAMVEARQESFLETGEWKRAYISTPTIKGSSKIEALYDGGDQRRWHVTCPGCGEQFVFEFDRRYFRFNDQYPFEAHYVAPCCGTVIEALHKNHLIRTGAWIATAPKEGAYPSYHFSAMSSPFVPWDKIAERYVKAQGNPRKMVAFWNLTLGLPYEVKGDAPDHELLMERRSHDLKRSHIPAGGLILVAAADVQMRGIWVEVKAFGKDRQSWVVDAFYIDGDTADPEGGAFSALAEVYERDYPDAFGGFRKVDLFGVDSGYRAHVVYSWTRKRHRSLALKGVDGWSRPAIGTGVPVDINFRGKRIRKGATVYAVGTWPLKGAFYTDLRLSGRSAGKEIDPPGYCHFGGWLDDVYFRQITSEYLAEEIYRGRPRKTWKVRNGEENHLLDCAVYNTALAEHLGLSRMTPADWAELEKERGADAATKSPKMFDPAPMQIAATDRGEAAADGGDAAGSSSPRGKGWIGRRGAGWLKGRS